MRVYGNAQATITISQGRDLTGLKTNGYAAIAVHSLAVHLFILAHPLTAVKKEKVVLPAAGDQVGKAAIKPAVKCSA